jgi:hypothetical protein
MKLRVDASPVRRRTGGGGGDEEAAACGVLGSRRWSGREEGRDRRVLAEPRQSGFFVGSRSGLA